MKTASEDKRVTDLELCFNAEPGGYHDLLQLHKPKPFERRQAAPELVARVQFKHHQGVEALKLLAELMEKLHITTATIKDPGLLLLSTTDTASVKRMQVQLWANSDTWHRRSRARLVRSVSVADQPSHACVTNSEQWGSGVQSWCMCEKDARYNAAITGGAVEVVGDVDGYCAKMSERITGVKPARARTTRTRVRKS